MKKIFYCSTILLITMTGTAQKPGAFSGTYPATKTIDQTDDFFGTKVTDPYRWLENDTSEETKDWVQQQNVVSRNYLDKIPFRDAIKKRLTELWNYEKYTAPFKEGGYTYFYKNDGLQNRLFYIVKKIMKSPKCF